MNYSHLQFRVENKIGMLTLSRPKALNALNNEVLKELDHFFSQKHEMRALIITGDGEKAFVAGADIKEMLERDPQSARSMALNGQLVFDKIESAPFVTIAAVNGFALGGGLELALSCDFIIASQSARLGLPEVSLGLIPGYGGTQRLSRLVGKNTARLIIFSGDIYSAEQCEKWGIVSLVVGPQELIAKATEVAKKIVERSPYAIQLAKKAVLEGVELSQAQGLQKEADLFQAAFASQEGQEGIRAFVEKRKPSYSL